MRVASISQNEIFILGEIKRERWERGIRERGSGREI